MPTTTQKIRQGTSSSGSAYYVKAYTYTSKSYSGATVYQVATETSYPSESTSSTASDRLITSYSYTWIKDISNVDTTSVETQTITYPTVSTANNGSNAATTRIVHYKQDLANSLYYNDWTQREDGTYSYSEQNTKAQVIKSIEDVDTSSGDVSGLPSGWSARTTSIHLKTSYTYDSYGRSLTITDPSGKKTVYGYFRQKVTNTGKETTTAYVTLTAEHMDGSGKYDYVPLRISVSDPGGKTIVSAAGLPTTGTDGNTTGMSDDWG
jgi:hypothetical protein